VVGGPDGRILSCISGSALLSQAAAFAWGADCAIAERFQSDNLEGEAAFYECDIM
jgi:hypothetical protein